MAKKNAYALNAAAIVQTLERLHERIEARFPGSGLGKVCAAVVDVGKHTAKRAHAIARPYVGIRILFAAFVLTWATLLILGGRMINWSTLYHQADIFTIAPPLESFVNLAIVMVTAIFFVGRWESTLKRKRVYRALYQLRSLAHVIDMHQLTKDPSVELGNGKTTTVSPERMLSDFELSRYLDYCTEMLSLIAKLAALYAGQTEDSDIITAANEVENLTTNLGRKIWQKIMIISQLEDRTVKPG